MQKYTKAFEEWWTRADTYLPVKEIYVSSRVKRIAFNAWKASRRRIVHLNRDVTVTECKEL